MTSIHLNGHHRKTLASIFSHPESHNIEWHDVLSLLNYLGTANEGHNGSYDIAIGDEHHGNEWNFRCRSRRSRIGISGIEFKFQYFDAVLS